MAVREHNILKLATAVSDDTPIDWEEAEGSSIDDQERALVRHLRMVADLARVHRSLQPTESLPETSMAVAPTVIDRQAPGHLIHVIEEPPSRWAHLEIQGRVGEGAFGEVFRAWDGRLEREVALKLLRRRESMQETLASQVIQEGRLLARVRHTNVVTVYGAERHDERVGLWMEFIRGRTLAALLRDQGSFGAPEATLIGLDLCHALAAVHRAGLVHRDIKAQNVMREEGGRIVLMDFGAGREVKQDGESAARSISGTPLYMAPEVLRGEQAAASSDIYSLGVLLYHLVTGAYPVSGRTLPELREAHQRRDMKLLRDVRPDLPADFVRVVERALAPEPERRYATAGAMEAALTRSQAPEPEPQRTGTPAPEPWAQRLSRELACRRTQVAVLGSILLVTAALVILPRWPPPSEASKEQQASGLPLASAGGALTPSEKVAAPGEGTKREPPDAAASGGLTPLSSFPTSSPTAGPQVTKHRQHRPVTASPVALIAEATLYRMGAIVSEPLSPGDTIRPGDQLYLELEGEEPMHVYVVNQDRAGATYLLFPLPGGSPANPLEARVRHRLPGSLDGGRKNWQVDTAGGKELFLIIASRQPLEELEQALGQMDRAQMQRSSDTARTTLARQGQPDGGEERRRIRGVGSLAEPEPLAGSSPAGRQLTELLNKITSRPGASDGIWVKEFLLENPDN